MYTNPFFIVLNTEGVPHSPGPRQVHGRCTPNVRSSNRQLHPNLHHRSRPTIVAENISKSSSHVSNHVWSVWFCFGRCQQQSRCFWLQHVGDRLQSSNEQNWTANRSEIWSVRRIHSGVDQIWQNYRFCQARIVVPEKPSSAGFIKTLCSAICSTYLLFFVIIRIPPV